MARTKKLENISSEDILREAAQIIQDRAESRDTPDGEKTFSHTAAMCNAMLRDKLKEDLTGEDIALINLQQKIARSRNGSVQKDDYQDAAAYMALAFEERVSEE